MSGIANVSLLRQVVGVLGSESKVGVTLYQALFLPVSKKLRAQKTQKISASKKLKGHFEQKTQCVGVNLRFQLKNFEILTI